MKYPHIWRAVMETPWAMEPGKLAALREVLELRVTGGVFSPPELRARIGPSQEAAQARHATDPSGWTVETSGTTPQAASGSAPRTAGAVAVIPVFGIISQRMSMLDDISGPGGTSTERVAEQLRAALASSDVGSIILNVDSPGGSVYGVQELADQIYQARGQKPIIAVANSMAASAAYWIASAAEELVVTPGGEVGSIGVYTAHEDISALLEMEGVRPTLISAGAYKVEASPYGPLSDEARQYIQSRVNEYYGMFTQAVARNRGVKRADVTGGFGEGRVVGAQAAVRDGMADRVATLDETIQRLAKGGGRKPSARALAQEVRGERREASEGVAADADTLILDSTDDIWTAMSALAATVGTPEAEAQEARSEDAPEQRRRRLLARTH